jgi:hypothetical protein
MILMNRRRLHESDEDRISVEGELVAQEQEAG